jgi:kumamolisin
MAKNSSLVPYFSLPTRYYEKQCHGSKAHLRPTEQPNASLTWDGVTCEFLRRMSLGELFSLPFTAMRQPTRRREMRRSCFAAIFVVAALVPVRAADSVQVFSESVKEVARSASGTPGAHTPFISRSVLKLEEASAPMEFEVSLKMRNFAELQQRVAKHELISANEMAERYQPTAPDYQRVADWITGEGLSITRRDPNHMALFASGTVSQIGQALQVSFARVTSAGSDYTSAVTAPSVPAALAPLLVGINGLQPHLRAHKNLLKPSSLSGNGAPYLPSQIAAAYNATGLYSSNLTGAGQSIAVVIDTFPAASDLTSFWQTYSVNQSIDNITFIQVVSGTLPTDTSEATLDTEWTSSIAPGAQVRVYATKDLAYTDTDQAYEQIYTDVTTHPGYGIHQVSLSYGGGETTSIPAAQFTSDSQYFASLAAVGVTVFAASGDGGSTPDNAGGTTGPTQAEYPASDPNVTGVGGTTLETNYYTGSLEFGWSLSGGGTSMHFSRPAYQSGVTGMPAGSQRAVPDVASSADPNYGGVVILNGEQTAYGGTSLSTPTWAGFCALINQARASASPSLTPIGALNSALYPLLGTSSITDITSGNNGFAAGPGYDLVTGVGVPNMSNLVPALAPGFIRSPESILHTFQSSSPVDAESPTTALIQGTDGNFYGTTSTGGSSTSGTVYKMTSQGVVTILHNFGDGSVVDDGFQCEAALVQGSDGNFYGTTEYGGSVNFGAIFKMTPQGVVTILHSFYDGSVTQDGYNPRAALIQGTDGNFYGTTGSGGSASEGTIFKMTPQGAVTIVHSFGDGSVPNEGLNPSALVQGSDGNFYGTAQSGGAFDKGTIFRMTPQGVVTTLHDFGSGNVSDDGANPNAPLIQASDGNFYGTTSTGGSADEGVVFQMIPTGAVTTFHSFSDGSVANDGEGPNAALIQASNGNFYGTTPAGGSASQGTIFQMTPGGAVTILHNFYDGTVTNDGVGPQAGVVQGTDGNFYGTTEEGGSASDGTAFKLTSQIGAGFTSPNSATFTVGLAGSFNVTASGSPTPTLSARDLPLWASFNATTGVLSGTPPNTTGQPYILVFTANNHVGGLAAQTFTLGVQTVSSLMAPAITSGPISTSAVVDSAYSFSYHATGAPAPAFSLSSGTLPEGLSLSPAGILSGTPLQSGTFTGTVKASNGVGTAATQSFTLTVARAPVFVGGPSSVNTLSGAPFTTVGFPAPTFSLISGNLPSGLTLSSTGVVSGTPTQAGQFNGTVTATNSAGSDTSSFVISVDEEPSFTSGAPTTTAVLNEAYSFNLEAGGFPASTFTLTSGTLPPGISLSGGVLSGFPNTTGTFTGTIMADNGVGTAAAQNFSITVGQSATFGNEPLSASVATGSSYSFTYQSSGFPAPTFAVTSGSLPPGLNLSALGMLSGTPTQTGIFTGVITATNALGSSTQDFTITIAAPAPPLIANGPPPAGTTNELYNFVYLTTGFPAPTFTVATGSLPPGLSLSAEGVISGTPTLAGTYSGTVSASNGLNPAATQAFTIEITQSSLAYSILHNFEDGTVSGDGTDLLAGLVQGTDGDLYGVTNGGGSQSEGTFFKITPQGVETILHDFHDGTVAGDGEQPAGTLVEGPDGNFYGTTQEGGSSGDGTVFKITPAGVETILYAFGGAVSDGKFPYGALTIGKEGDFYGTTLNGGSDNEGIVFKITAQGVETILHNFGDGSVANDGSGPRGGLIQATDGNFYGMTPSGGSAGEGTMFRMTTAGVMTILHSFGDGSITVDGATPLSGLVQAPDGDLYGLTKLGGLSGSGTTYGTFFKITTSGTMTILHLFGDGTTPSDALQPWDALIIGADGNFYGTSYFGGTIGYGSIFEATTQGAVAIRHSFKDGSTTNDGANPATSLVRASSGGLYGGTTEGGSASMGTLFQLSVTGPPLITSAAGATFTAGRADSFTVTATGTPAPTFSVTGLPSWASLNATTGVLSGTPPSTTGAPFTLNLTATNGIAPSATQTLTLNVQVVSVLTFNAWEASFPNPITSGPSATPENDGVPNVLKYVFDIDPTRPMTSADRAALPTLGLDTTSNPGTDYLTLTYREFQELDASATVVTAQTSSDLQTWQNVASRQVGTNSNGDPVMEAEVTVTGARQFLRLHVSSP